MDQEEQYLRLLSIFHYVVAGLTALFSCFALPHIAMGIAMQSEGPEYAASLLEAQSAF